MKVEVDVLGSTSLIVLMVCGSKATVKESERRLFCSELRSCVKVEVDILGSPVPNSPYGLCGRKATLNLNFTLMNPELRSCVNVEVDVLGSPPLIVCIVSVDVKQH